MGIKILCGKCGKAVCSCALLLNLAVASVAEAEAAPNYPVETISAATMAATGAHVVMVATHDQVSGQEIFSFPQADRMLWLGYSAGGASRGFGPRGPTGSTGGTGEHEWNGENGPPPPSRG
jgi:hypothetical protein